MSDLPRVWEECWTRVSRGEATIEDCVRRYPEYAEDLRQLFTVVVRLSQGRLVRPNAAYKARARAQLLERIRSPREMRSHQEIRAHREMRAHQEMRTYPAVHGIGETGARREIPVQPRGPMRLWGDVIPFVFRFGLALAAVLFLLLVSGTMLAQAALPGDPLYTWKTGSEKVFRAVYPDPLTADLILMDRRAKELTRVAGTPAAEHVAQEAYQRVLSDLPQYTDPSSQTKIRKQLTEQKTQLQQAGVNMPAIDRTLNNLSAAPAITPTPSGAGGEGPRPTSPPGPTASLTPNSVLPIKPTITETAAPTRRPTRTPNPTRTPRARSTPGPTQESLATGELTPRASSTETPTSTLTNTPTPTPCISGTPTRPSSRSKPCATSTFSLDPCGTETTQPSPPSCGTPTRTATPTNTSGSDTVAPTGSNSPPNAPTPMPTTTGMPGTLNLFDTIPTTLP